jgi:hypothetical protein
VVFFLDIGRTLSLRIRHYQCDVDGNGRNPGIGRRKSLTAAWETVSSFPFSCDSYRMRACPKAMVPDIATVIGAKWIISLDRTVFPGRWLE